MKGCLPSLIYQIFITLILIVLVITKSGSILITFLFDFEGFSIKILTLPSVTVALNLVNFFDIAHTKHVYLAVKAHSSMTLLLSVRHDLSNCTQLFLKWRLLHATFGFFIV